MIALSPMNSVLTPVKGVSKQDRHLHDDTKPKQTKALYAKNTGRYNRMALRTSEMMV